MDCPSTPEGLSPLAAACTTDLPAVRPAPRLLRRLVQRLVDGLACGSLHLRLPDGQLVSARAAAAGPEASLSLHAWRPLWRLALGGDIGLAEAYQRGEWSSPDLAALLELGIRNEAAWDTPFAAAWPLRALLRLRHLRNANTRRGSRRNIAFHYDLGNDFYRHWLDADLIYSSGIYRTPGATLEVAQAEKLARILQLLDLPQDGTASVLEIGCGWGALATALGQRGATVTGLTLSAEQLTHARARLAAEGLAPRVDLRLQDYRDVGGRYQRIVSIEMIEAVGERYWPTYFATLRDRLAPGGHAVIQAITIADSYAERYRRQPDFIQRYIFPGGMLLSPAALRSQAANAGLSLEPAETFGLSYAETLAEWRYRFARAWPQIAQLGFDDAFRRLWEYYLCYCEAGFKADRVDVGLYVLRPQAPHAAA